ncbi:TetR family transcriptional regulator [Streptomyces sp. NBC_01525]|uniref:TetR family transcriptional regulator n=1 Tax=Streptomyces benahoarensis TaxID=2595054 RepID=A0A553ZMF9_9ACTN|nr:TetR family transcriptional regulator [Streptomyces benahoarensis]TSB31350.1 TetR family transcriptional regulator [Streptomyces benahoarensis]TSB42593.1 TetR family transcriptional regulator [Streptomyces benahoarensis]
MDPSTPHEAALCGLRARKKQRTRDSLIRAALELFTAQGYEATTVDEIAAAVDVSQRTFFRYFSNKEEVAFAVQEMVEARFLEELRHRPADEAPLTALRSSVMAAWDGIAASIEPIVPVELHMRAYQMIESTPALIAAHMRRSCDLEEEIARLLARREGLDADRDPRPRVLVGAFNGVMRAAGKAWSEGDEVTVASIRELTHSYLDHIGPALDDNWREER